MKINNLVSITLMSLALTLSSCGVSSNTKDSSTNSENPPTSIDTGTSEDTTSTDSPSSEQPSTNVDPSTDPGTTNEDTSTNTPSSSDSSTQSESSSDEPIIEPVVTKYYVTVNNNEYVTITFLEGYSEEGIEKDTTVKFSIEVQKGYAFTVSGVFGEYTLTFDINDNVYSFLMPEADVTINVETTQLDYGITFVGDNVYTLIIGQKERFHGGEEVTVNVSNQYGYELVNVEIKTSSNQEVTYTHKNDSSQYTFVMPYEDVQVISTVNKKYTVSVNNSEHSKVNIADKDYYSAGEEISFTVLITDDKYELDTVSVLDSSNNPVTVTMNAETYTFTMPKSNVTIKVSEKAKPVESNDPFKANDTYEGKWALYYGGYDYDMRLRFVFHGDGSLDWYLTYEDVGGDDWWTNANITNGPVVQKATSTNSKPSGMIGDLKAGYLGVNYVVKDNQLIFTTPVKMTTVEVKCNLTMQGTTVKSITVLNDMSDDYYTTGGRTLTKI